MIIDMESTELYGLFLMGFFYLLEIFALFILAIAVVIRIGFFVKCLFFKKSTNQFWTLTVFWKRFAVSLDLLVPATLV